MAKFMVRSAVDNSVMTVLMVALDYPPCQSAGVQRTIKFIEYLPDYGWAPAVLTGQPHMYDQLADIFVKPSVPVYRAFGLNTLKHLSFRGKHFAAMLKPDRFFSWYWHGVVVGKNAIDKERPDVLWSTFPCSTAMKIALRLKQVTGLPWVADFRDPFAGINPYFNAENNAGFKIDEAVVRNADKLVFSTQRTAALYREAYPFIAADKIHVITNGFNEEEFTAAEQRLNGGKSSETKPYTLLHSGVLYPNGRDPKELFAAVSQLIKANELSSSNFKVVFRGLLLTEELRVLIEKFQLADIIEFKPPISYEQSVDEMLAADALLLLQGEMFNNQIPGKAYEYLRSGKPVLALTHKAGATAELIEDYDGVYIADMQSSNNIKQQLLLLVNSTKSIHRDIECYSRKSTAKSLARLLDGLV